ncbi:uncharacterized protein LOC131935669 isoform X2 [Physella acuta]|uniref:uncharacterized protein LOC131935669 isoform X2 n=1 Tax=Physella acuta TaxID=109671 RepID=UPI0027DC2ED4|nr:uncharacterized protein LOC131935669 isoform X2 [Physella acuta]
MLPRDNELATVKIVIKDFIPFQTTLHDSLWLSVNGLISFGVEFASFSPQRLPAKNSQNVSLQVLAPYWTDLDFKTNDDNEISYQLYQCSPDQPSDVCRKANSEVVKNSKNNPDSYTATSVLVVTWIKVPAKNKTSDNERVSFQCVIISDGQTSYVIYLYVQGAMNLNPTYARSVEVGWGNVNFDTTRYSYYTFDRILGNTGKPGIWFFKLGETTNYNAKCLSWFQSASKEIIEITAQNNDLPACPCNELAAKNSPTWISNSLSQTEGNCYDLLPNYGEFGRRCCYRSDGSSSFESRKPLSGSLQRYNAFYYIKTKSRDHEVNDRDPKRWCCDLSNQCELYYTLRPTKPCISSNWVRAFLFGDPHIVTLDQRPYIFNGLGEYKILQIKDNEKYLFMMQGRTCIARNANGTDTKATVWCAFAIYVQDNTTVRIEISPSKKVMIIYANNQDYTNKFQDAPNFTAFEKQTLLRRVNDSLEISFPNSIGITVSLTYELLEFSVTLDKKYQNKTSGLLGNFNNISTDDFIFPNGTSFPDSSKEREIYSYVETWSITQEESLFQYILGQNTSTFSNNSFDPLMMDEQSNDTKSQALQVCKDIKNIPCIYDFIITRNKNIASGTLNSDAKFKSESKSTANIAPSTYLSNSKINTKINETISFNVTGVDPDGVINGCEVLSNNKFLLQNIQNGYSVSIAVSNNEPINIAVSTIDNRGLHSEPASITTTVCLGCSEHGVCNYEITRNTSNPYYYYSTCDCDIGYTGENCETDKDGCTGNPCYPGNCIDILASVEQITGKQYTCKTCPDGFELFESNTTLSCKDIDECKANKCGDNGQCVNTYGSFFCNCNRGFRLFNKTICIDINECTEKLNNCDQLCINTNGNYTCSCFPGFIFKANNNLCEKVETDPCEIKSNKCEYSCRSGSNGSECFCKNGFQLNENGYSCEDIDECKSRLCPQNCLNTIGGYKCSCFVGYKMSKNDERSCEACTGNSYGTNCTKHCNCHGNAVSCDNIRGCICQDNWKGENCDTDVNECEETPNICPPDYYCTNTLGSYTCDCATGFEDINGTCININECDSLFLNTCPQECIDTTGSFVCECYAGYSKSRNGSCLDIEECKTGLSDCEQKCVNVQGGYNCDCYAGYILKDDRKSCEKEVDPCINFYLNCSVGCSIINSTAQCFCGLGYNLGTNGYDCIDIDECSLAENPCNGTCRNTPGSYFCSCPIGKELQNDKTTCLVCDAYHWGENCNTTCDCSPKGTTLCDPTLGCQCKEGWAGDKCQFDLDECSNGTILCSNFSTCINTVGSFICPCNNGYIKNNSSNGTCADIDECAGSSSSPCDHICTNTFGSFQCSCHEGFKLNDTKCFDINECIVPKLNKCDQKCRNTEGSFACECLDGYELNVTTSNTCYLSNSSAKCETGVCDQFCHLENGSPVCSCREGFLLNADNKTCLDIDECAENICIEGHCYNLNGSFSCSCDNGTMLLEDKLTCQVCPSGFYGYDCAANCSCNTTNTKPQICFAENGTCDCLHGWTGSDCSTDVDECNTSPCQENSICYNYPGTYKCPCNKGYFESSNGCEACDSTHYGNNCKEKCQCIQLNTNLCNSINGSCTCEPGWTGVHCETDIDECLNTSYCPDEHDHCFNINGSAECRCDEGYGKFNNSLCIDVDECLDSSNRCNVSTTICNNIEGSYNCACKPGHIDVNDSSTCKVNYSSYSLKVALQFPTVSNPLIFIMTTIESKKLTREIEESLTQFGRKLYGNAILPFVVYNLTPGSIIVHTYLQVDLMYSKSPSYSVSSFAFELKQAKNLTVGSITTVVEDVTVNNISVGPISNICSLYGMLKTCPENEKCMEVSVPDECKNDEKETYEMIIGLSVGLGLFVILVISIAILIVLYFKRRSVQKHHSSLHSNDRDSISEAMFRSIVMRRPLGYPSMYSPESYIAPVDYPDRREDQYLRTLHQQAGISNSSECLDEEPGPLRSTDRSKSTEDITADKNTARFSWTHMFDLLNQHKGFAIKRPTFEGSSDLKESPTSIKTIEN